MSNLFGWSTGINGSATIGGAQAPGVALVNGSTGSYTLSGTYPAFAAGQLILIIQLQGSGVGTFQLNRIKSYVTGTITLAKKLNANYTTSGSNYAVAQIIPQYQDLAFSSTVTTNVWSGFSGGIIALCANNMVIDQEIRASGTGFYGGVAPTTDYTTGRQGDGSVSGGVLSSAANGSAAGGGTTEGRGGGGGGGAGTGVAGQSEFGGSTLNGGAGGLGIATTASSDLHFGGGGGSGGKNTGATAGNGGRGGGIIFLIANRITIVGSSGLLTANGDSGQDGGTGFSAGAGGGGGAGTIYLLGNYVDVGSDKIRLLGGSGGVKRATYGGAGGRGAKGKVVIDCCSFKGNISSTYAEIVSINKGGFDFCSSLAQMVG